MKQEHYVNLTQFVEYLKKVRQNRYVNTSPYMDNALLNVQQLLETAAWSPTICDSIEIGGCRSCKWSGRTQKCSCCRRNRYIKDCWEKKDG